MSWKKIPLGKLCTIEKGKIGIKKAIPGEYPLVVTAEERRSHNEYHFDGKAVIIPLVSSTGHGHRSLKRIHFQSGKFAVGSILGVVMPKDESILRADYLYRFLDLNREKELVSRMKGMANVSLPIKEIAKIEIPVPSIKDQIEFVKSYNNLELKSLDLETELSHQLDYVKQLRQAFLREAIQGKLTKEWRAQNPELIAGSESASELLKKITAEKERLVQEKKIKKQKPLPPIKEEEIPFEIPENWQWCRLGEITFDQAYGTSTKAVLENDVPILRMGNISSNGEILYSKLKYISKDNKDLPRLYLKEGDLVFNRTNSFELVGKCAVFEKKEKFTLASYLIRIRFDKSMSSNFVSNYINSSLCRDTQIEPKIIQQNGQANFNGTKLSTIIIPLPPLPEQNQIVKKLERLMSYCDDLEASIKASKEQNEQLLQQVLREALEPKDEEIPKELSIAAEPEVEYEISKSANILPFMPRVVEPEMRRVSGDSTTTVHAALVTRILVKNDALGKQKRHLGRTLVEKTVHVVESQTGNDFGRTPIRYKWGAVDYNQIRNVESHAQKKRWFNSSKKENKTFYTKGIHEFDGFKKSNEYFRESLDEVDRIIDLFLPLKTKTAEVYETTYAAWHDLIAMGYNPSEEEIVMHASTKEGWTVEKESIPKQKFFDAIKWITKNELVPNGKGKYSKKLN